MFPKVLYFNKKELNMQVLYTENNEIVTATNRLFVGELWVDIASKSFSPPVELTHIMLLERKWELSQPILEFMPTLLGVVTNISCRLTEMKMFPVVTDLFVVPKRVFSPCNMSHDV